MHSIPTAVMEAAQNDDGRRPLPIAGHHLLEDRRPWIGFNVEDAATHVKLDSKARSRCNPILQLKAFQLTYRSLPVAIDRRKTQEGPRIRPQRSSKAVAGKGERGSRVRRGIILRSKRE